MLKYTAVAHLKIRAIRAKKLVYLCNLHCIKRRNTRPKAIEGMLTPLFEAILSVARQVPLRYTRRFYRMAMNFITFGQRCPTLA